MRIVKQPIPDSGSLDENLNRYGPTTARPHAGEPAWLKSVVVDTHSHVHIAEASRYAVPFRNPAFGVKARLEPEQSKAISKVQRELRYPRAADIESRIEDMDRMGVDIQVVSSNPSDLSYDMELEPAVRHAQLVNEGLAEFVAQRPDRLAGMGHLPLQHPDAAIDELERIVSKHGFRSVLVLGNINGAELSQSNLDPLFLRLEELEVVLMIHPASYPQADRITRFNFLNTIGNPLDTTVALSYFIHDGVLERFPRLKVLAVHGGGYLPAYMGRMDHAWGARRDARASLPRPPSSYLRRMYFDGLVFNTLQLEHLIRAFGADHVVLGTDYPFDMGEYNPVQHLKSVELLDEAGQRAIGGETAVELFKLRMPSAG